MRLAILLLGFASFAFGQDYFAQVPKGFSWVNLESNTSVMAKVRGALHDPAITAIREVGVEGDFALVMTASRELGAPTPDYDQWTIYNVSLSTGETHILLTGYGVKPTGWIQDELAITYYDCRECEPAILFTTFHFVAASGWVVRWTNLTSDGSVSLKPGAVVAYGDVGEPYDDNEATQIFEVVLQSKGGFAAGSWLHTRNVQTGKIEDDVERYSTDPATGKDRVQRLRAEDALRWERRICKSSNFQIDPAMGQDSPVCRKLVGAAVQRESDGK